MGFLGLGTEGDFLLNVEAAKARHSSDPDIGAPLDADRRTRGIRFRGRKMSLEGFLRSASSRRGEKGTSAGQDMTTNIDILLVHDDFRYVSGVHIGYCNYCSGCRQKFQRMLGTPICGLEQL